MYPGLSDTDCQVAMFHYRQLVDEGQRQQMFGGLRLVTGVRQVLSASMRRQVGAFLVGAGQRLQSAQTVSSESLVSTATGEMGAIA